MSVLFSKKLFFSISLVWFSLSATCQVVSLKEQAAIEDSILNFRIDSLLPQLMEQTHIDCWVLITREYNEDPIIKTMLPATWLNARRRTILVFYRNTATNTYKKYAISRYQVGNKIEAKWDMQKFPNQWDALVHLLQELKPNKIGINTSQNFAHADGLTYNDYTTFSEKLPADYKEKLVSAEPLAIAWLETRTSVEMEWYKKLILFSKKIIAKGFSNQVIKPGVTTTEDLVWWFRQEIIKNGFTTWFHPSVEIQRNNLTQFDHLTAFSSKANQNDIILPGDLLHVDFGITYLRLNTDIQEHAYVLYPNEHDAPVFLQNALKVGNQLQDLLTNNFKEGKTGNDILKETLEQAKQAGIKATIYSHPIGYHGHAAGPAIGLWDQQNGVVGSGDAKIHNQTCYSIELNAEVFIKEWNKPIRIMLEQDGYFDNTGFSYINGRQTKLHLIKAK